MTTTIATQNDVYLSRLERRLPHNFNIQLAICEAREWIIECCIGHGFDLNESLELVENMSDESVIKYISKNWDGGLSAFAALAPELAR